MDKIRITGIEAFGHHGVFPEETKNGQIFRVSLELELDTRAAGETDDLTKTVNYADVIALAEKHITGEPVKLIETLAERIAGDILKNFPPVRALTVEAHKPNAPVPVKTDDICVVIRREQCNATVPVAHPR